MRSELRTRLRRLVPPLEIQAPEAGQVRRRIRTMERHIILPAKIAVMAMLFHSLFYTPWMGIVSSALDVAVETTISVFWVYAGATVIGGVLILLMDRLPLPMVQWTVITLSLIDAIFLAVLTLLTGGHDSILFWLFVGLIVRNAISVPSSGAQIILNFATSGCYLLAGVSDLVMASYLEEPAQRTLGLVGSGSPAESLTLRVLLLWLLALCVPAVQLLLERQRAREDEARELEVREGQLRSSGRLAAEIAHQLKNPLAIINNSVFNLLKAGRKDPSAAEGQLLMIREEVERADRILTRVMDYGKLTEGQLEKLDLSAALAEAIARVIPDPGRFRGRVERELPPRLPPLLMQREHLADILVNLLQNAREAAGESGVIQVSARSRPGLAMELTVGDDGPGIPVDRLVGVFEAYYTTKEKGTGLGLSIVKHNVELYGGTVTAESELGKGARFTVRFPEKILANPAS